MTNLRNRRDIENVTVEEALDLFFEPPSADRGDGWVSPLCLCRQELQDCLVGQIVGEDRIFNHPRHRLFASAMVTLSGIELLARMVPPPSQNAGRGDMFLSIVTQYSILARTPVSEDDAQVLLRLRNALSHTFGLYCEGKGGVHVPLVVISSDQPDEQLVRPREDGAHEVCLERLVRLFNTYRRGVPGPHRTDADATPAIHERIPQIRPAISTGTTCAIAPAVPLSASLLSLGATVIGY